MRYNLHAIFLKILFSDSIFHRLISGVYEIKFIMRKEEGKNVMISVNQQNILICFIYFYLNIF